MTIESWRFRDPSMIMDRVMFASEKERARSKKRAAQVRKQKSRRIRALVKGALRGLAK